ncbi:MAG: PPC domain-containing protein [Hyphomonadaceae bacterium JAD_PAG50586_4]|nr:MAG: PPC domain-containing protein [Hyphomonadaceae bacterium JAD_PAG50586_4]
MDDDGGGNLNSYLEFMAPTTGNYFIEARGFMDDAVGGYTLSASEGEIPADATTDVALSAEGDYREGVLAPAGDKDWYRLELAEGQSVRIGLTSAESADPLPDPYLILYGADGAELARDDDSGDGLNAWLEYTATSAGPVFVEARGFGEDAAGRYVISLNAGEVGDNAEMAEYLVANSEGRVSLIGAEGDVDWFAVDLIEGRPHRFYVDSYEPGPLVDPLLTLLDENGQQIAQDDDGGAGLNSYLAFTSPAGGRYYLAVSGYAGVTGRYFIRAIDTEVPGNINSDEYLDGAGDDRINRIEIPGDVDAYHVELEAGVRYTIDVRGHGDSPLGDAFLAVLDSNGERVASDDDAGAGMDARLRFTPQTSGSYILQASGLGGSIGGIKFRSRVNRA